MISREQLSFQLSADLSYLVKKKYLMDSYGIKLCSDPRIDGDLYDIFLKKIFVISDFDCDDAFKTDLSTIKKLKT